MSTDQPGNPNATEPTHDRGAPEDGTEAPAPGRDPLRGSRTSGTWIAAVALSLVLVLLAVFILQNTQRVEVSLLGWNGRAPLAATLLIAAAGGALVVATAGALRILQLRRRVKHQRTG
ncbi:lipopolysaccharide assembly protein LapA domain-containing protein [Nocardioides panacisoli]|uniref:DUF1049 domain-containing protein n=1 Tax=Nocardioides panacisoli TaxID=627624 RepID=A0ABP7I1M4_9ACTN